jgi:hypothetical protein
LTVTNDPVPIVISGTLELSRDRVGLKSALALLHAIGSVVDALQAEARR